LGDKLAVRILFEDVAPRFADRPGGYTRVVRLAKPRLGDAGEQAVLEFVGVRDRAIAKATSPAFESGEAADDDAMNDRDEPMHAAAPGEESGGEESGGRESDGRFRRAGSRSREWKELRIDGGRGWITRPLGHIAQGP
jgi:large subunit ribosomal protein L17